MNTKKAKSKKETIRKAKVEKFSKVRFTKVKLIRFDRQEQGRTISISDLPNCDHKKFLLDIIQDATRSKICVVAYHYPGTNSWDVTAGYPDIRDIKTDMDAKEVGARVPGIGYFDIQWLCENVNDVAAVRMLGSLLPYKVALKLFPEWDVLTYKVTA